MPSLFNQAHSFSPTERSDGWGEWVNSLLIYSSFVSHVSLYRLPLPDLCLIFKRE